MHYFAHHRRWPDLAAPRRFTEKIVRRKLVDRDPRLPLFADKISAKAYVAHILGPRFVTPTLWSGDRLPPRAQRDWPIPYVLKANHRSGANIFVREARDADWDAIEPRCQAWLESSHADWVGEWAYRQIAPKLLVEPYLGAPDRLPPTTSSSFSTASFASSRSTPTAKLRTSARFLTAIGSRSPSRSATQSIRGRSRPRPRSRA